MNRGFTLNCTRVGVVAGLAPTFVNLRITCTLSHSGAARRAEPGIKGQTPRPAAPGFRIAVIPAKAGMRASGMTEHVRRMCAQKLGEQRAIAAPYSLLAMHYARALPAPAAIRSLLLSLGADWRRTADVAEDLFDQAEFTAAGPRGIFIVGDDAPTIDAIAVDPGDGVVGVETDDQDFALGRARPIECI